MEFDRQVIRDKAPPAAFGFRQSPERFGGSRGILRQQFVFFLDEVSIYLTEVRAVPAALAAGMKRELEAAP